MAKIIPIEHAQSLQEFNRFADVCEVLSFYSEQQLKLGKKVRFTQNRQKHISKLLDKYTVEELCLVIEYICTGKEHYPTWMREKGYANFSNMFRVKKIANKLDKAKAWLKEQNKEVDDFNVVHLPFQLGE